MAQLDTWDSLTVERAKALLDESAGSHASGTHDAAAWWGRLEITAQNLLAIIDRLTERSRMAGVDL